MLRNDLKIVKNDDLVEKKQETMFVNSLHENRRMVDVYMEWYEKKFKEICEKYGFEKGPMCPRDCMVEGMHVIGDKANNFEDQEAKRDVICEESHDTNDSGEESSCASNELDDYDIIVWRSAIIV